MRGPSAHENGCVTGKDVPAWRRWLQSYPVAAFFLLTFIFSWGIWGAARALFPGASSGLRITVYTLGLCGPTVAALVMSALLYGRQGVADLLKQITRWRVGLALYLFAVFSTLVVGFAAIGAYTLFGAAIPPFNLHILPALVPLPAGLPEEYGWRGFALPHLLKKRSALIASLIIALFWVLWHIPISPALKHVSFLGLFLLEVIPLTILFSWLYINSRGSILLVVLYHLVYNTVINVLNIPGSITLWAVYIGLNWVLAAIVIIRCGASRLMCRRS
jgi:membrane protease YdiL (CAAX protease family)